MQLNIDWNTFSNRDESLNDKETLKYYFGAFADTASKTNVRSCFLDFLIRYMRKSSKIECPECKVMILFLA